MSQQELPHLVQQEFLGRQQLIREKRRERRGLVLMRNIQDTQSQLVVAGDSEGLSQLAVGSELM